MKVLDDNACRWGAIAINLGDRHRQVDSIPNFGGQFRAYGLTANAELLGYGLFHESTIPPAEAISGAIEASVAASGIDKSRVDGLILAATEAEFADGSFIADLLLRHGFVHALPLTITSQECAGLLSGIDLACRYICGGLCRNVIVVSDNRARREGCRVRPFGIVSDASTACLVSAELPLEFRRLSFALKCDVRGMRGDDDFASRKALIDAATAAALAGADMSLCSVARVFGSNLFRPLARFNSSSAGITEQQMYVGTARDVGHCLGADPLINLATYLSDDNRATAGEHYLLQSYAPGFLATMAVEYVGSSAQLDPISNGKTDVEVQSW